MQENVVHVVKENAEYLDPYAICEVRHNFSSHYEEGSAYIAFMTLKWKDRHYIWAPCNFQAYQHCITDGGIHNPERPKEMVVRTNFPCHKKPSGSVHYEYYVCEHIRMLGRYTTDPERALIYVFILREAVNPMGICYHPKHELAQKDK
ncbi:hypothetical protein SETIT_4G144000v2 [Setaria italica]|uniref:Uncharacterized protein n=1 Tax=Setaria italica TaxID=4555 RepID=A0A368QU54_SETIT|nr:hypothetical protein SETIT_4G144000v2 [Setaria italica]